VLKSSEKFLLTVPSLNSLTLSPFNPSTFYQNSLTLKPFNEIFQSLPDGQPRRMLDISKAEKEFNFRAKVNFENGLQELISWYRGGDEKRRKY